MLPKQLTQEQSIKLGESKFWEKMSYKEKFQFQLFQNYLCMPFSVFHEAAEKTLNRPIWTHEFAFNDILIKEFLGEKDAPSFQEILNLIPKDKRIVIGLEE